MPVNRSVKVVVLLPAVLALAVLAPTVSTASAAQPLTYLHNRYYDGSLGLFVTPDVFDAGKQVATTNRYTYAADNPSSLEDPSGLAPISRAAAHFASLFRHFEHGAGLPRIDDYLWYDPNAVKLAVPTFKSDARAMALLADLDQCATICGGAFAHYHSNRHQIGILTKVVAEMHEQPAVHGMRLARLHAMRRQLQKENQDLLHDAQFDFEELILAWNRADTYLSGEARGFWLNVHSDNQLAFGRSLLDFPGWKRRLNPGGYHLAGTAFLPVSAMLYARYFASGQRPAGSPGVYDPRRRQGFSPPVYQTTAPKKIEIEPPPYVPQYDCNAVPEMPC